MLPRSQPSTLRSIRSQLPPPGTAQNYTVNVTSATNSNVKASTAPSFNAPPLPTLDFTIDPISPSTVPGGTVSANLNIASVGNATTGPVTLTVTPPTGITVNGLTSPANVPLNGVVTEAISFTASPSLATNTYNVSFTASYTPSGGTTQQVPFTVPITVAALGSCAVSSASVMP